MALNCDAYSRLLLLVKLDVALAIHARVAHRRGLRFRRLDLLSGIRRWCRRESLLHRASRAVGDLVDVSYCEDIAQLPASGLDENCCWSLEVKE